MSSEFPHGQPDMQRMMEPQKENEQSPKRHVLKESESMILLDGKYLGEMGNTSYKEKMDMFEYDPNAGLLVSGQRRENTAMLDIQDLVQLRKTPGCITIERLLGSEARQFSDKEFLVLLLDASREMKQKVQMIEKLYELLNKNDQSERHFARAAEYDTDLKKKFPQYTPEQYFDAVLENLRYETFWSAKDPEQADEQEEFDETMKALKACGVFDADPKKSRDAIVNYFYLYEKIAGVDGNDADEFYEAFTQFPFVDALMKEYHRKPDGRFGDTLLGACLKLDQEIKREEAE